MQTYREVRTYDTIRGDIRNAINVKDLSKTIVNRIKRAENGTLITPVSADRVADFYNAYAKLSGSTADEPMFDIMMNIHWGDLTISSDRGRDTFCFYEIEADALIDLVRDSLPEKVIALLDSTEEMQPGLNGPIMVSDTAKDILLSMVGEVLSLSVPFPTKHTSQAGKPAMLLRHSDLKKHDITLPAHQDAQDIAADEAAQQGGGGMAEKVAARRAAAGKESGRGGS